MTWMMGQSTPSTNLQKLQNWEERHVSQVVVLPCRETWTGQGNGQRESLNLVKFGKGKCKALPLGSTSCTLV